MIVGLLGIQGAFRDHIPYLARCGAGHTIVTDSHSLGHIDRLIIPGGESTVMTKFLLAFDLLGPLRERILAGMPVWGVCAGAILLAREVDGAPGPLGVMPTRATRNAYGRQINSSQRLIDVPHLKIIDYPAIFIRAPGVVVLSPSVTIHAVCDHDPVFVQSKRIMATTFHPELNLDDRFHRYFISL
jgi:5'-phosphate synthase pdxT subunit